MPSFTVAGRQLLNPGSPPDLACDSGTEEPDTATNQQAVTSSTHGGKSSRPGRNPMLAVKMRRGSGTESPSRTHVELAKGKQESPPELPSPSGNNAKAKPSERASSGVPNTPKADKAEASPPRGERLEIEAILSAQRDPSRNHAMLYTVRYLPFPAHPKGLQTKVLEEDLLHEDEEAVYQFWEKTKDGRPPILEEDGGQKWEAYNILDWKIMPQNERKVLVHWAGFRPVPKNDGITWEPEENMREIPAVATMIDDYQAKNLPQGMAAKGKRKSGVTAAAGTKTKAVVKKVHVPWPKHVARSKGMGKSGGSVKRPFEEADSEYEHDGDDELDATGLRRSKRLRC